MWRSSSSRSKRRCSRTVAPARAAASRLSRPRMCDGGVATWNRSSGPRPSASHPVGGGVAHRPVGVAHRLGEAGGAGAEDEDGLVVLGPTAAGPTGCGRRRGSPRASPASSRSVTRSRTEERRRAARSPGPSATAATGAGELDGVTDLDRLPRRAEQHGRGAEPCRWRARRRRTPAGWWS